MAVDLKAPRRKWKLRKWFLAHGGKKADIPKGFNWKTPRVGKPARTLIKKVQWMAKLKHKSGQFDTATRRLLFPPSARKRVYQIAESQLGTHEWPSGSNWGPVSKFLKAVGITYGQPWCAAFVVWTLKKFGYKGPLPALPAYVPSWLAFAKNHNLLKPKLSAAQGDLLIFNWPGTDSSPDHIGICRGGFVNKQCKTVEGNIGSYGGQVTNTTRASYLIVAVIDTKKLLKLK